MLQIINSNNIRLSGVPLPLKLKITEDLTIENPAFIKAKQQRRPTWGIDQRLRLYLYDENGQLIAPRGYFDTLYARIAEYFLTLGIKPQFSIQQDFVEGNAVDFGQWNPAYQLRDYQTPCVDAMLAHNGVAVAPAGSGKTIMGMRFIHQAGRPTIWLTHTTDLMYQTKNRAEATLGGVGRIGLLGDSNKDYGDGKLIIATVQTLRADPKLVDSLVPYIGVVVIDEAHHFPAAQFIDTAAKFKARRIVGVTATPDRKDRLEDYMYLGIGPKLYTVDRGALYADTQLVKPAVRFIYTAFGDDPASQAEGTNVDLGGDDLDYTELLNALISNQDRTQLVAETIVKAIPEGPAIVIAESVRYCFMLQEAVLGITAQRGIKVSTAVVHGGLQRHTWRVARNEREAKTKATEYGTECRYDEKAKRWKVKTPQYTNDEYRAWQITPSTRKAVLQAVTDKQIDILFATQLAREGLDIPHLCVGHSVTPKRGDDHKSTTGAALEQEIGRIMRPDPANPDKKAVWYDYVDANVGIFKAQYYSRRRVYKRLGLVIPQKPKDTERDIVADFLGTMKY